MSGRLFDRVGTGALLGALALCAMLLSAVFFLHLRHDPAVASHRRVLPGLTLGTAGPALIVTSVQSGGEAARRGVAVGDDLIAIDGKAVHSLDQAEAYLVDGSRGAVVLELSRSGQVRQVALDRTGE